MDLAPSRFVVLRFQEDSVGTRLAWKRILRCLREHERAGRHPVLVCPALPGATDLLETISQASPSAIEAPLSRFCARHLRLASDLDLGDEGRRLVEAAAASIRSLRRKRCESRRSWSRSRRNTKRTRAERAAEAEHAAVLATGELLLTRLGAMWLNKQGLDIRWRDARTMLIAREDCRSYEDARCPDAPAPVLSIALSNDNESATITQGFIGQNSRGETVLLGRGCADTSACYLAAMLEAERVEIWGERPGIFTADPQTLPAARLISQVSYDEVETLVQLGAVSLHPSCLAPIRRWSIPLHIGWTEIGWTEGMSMQSTRVDEGDAEPAIKAIAVQDKLWLLRLRGSEGARFCADDAELMAEVCEALERHGMAVHTAAVHTEGTDAGELRVTIDMRESEGDAIDALVAELSSHCRVASVCEVCAVGVVGTKVREALPIASLLSELSHSDEVRLVHDSPSGTHIDFFVEPPVAERVVSELHSVLFGEDEPSTPTWGQLQTTRRRLQAARSQRSPDDQLAG